MKFRNMRKIWQQDWRRISRNPVAIIIVAGICLLPSLYAWVNIQASWNIYENTGSIPVAIVNNDQATTFRDREIHIGRDVVEELKGNDKINWQFVNERQADLGLADGTYFAAIIFPEDFSAKFTTMFSGNPEKPKILYKVDTKINPVAGKITESAKNTLVEEITQNFVFTLNESIFAILNPVGKDADTNLQDIIKMKDAIVGLNNHLPLVTTTMNALHDNSGNLNQFLTSMNAAWPLVESGLNTVSQTAVSQQELSRSTQQRLNNSLDYMDTNLAYIHTSSQRAHALFLELNLGVSEGNTAKMNTAFNDLDALLRSMEDSVGATSTYLSRYQRIDWNSDTKNAVARLTSLKASLTNMKQQLTEVQKNLKQFSADSEALSEYLDRTLPQLEEQINTIDSSISSAIAALESVNQSLSSEQITALIESLRALQNSGLKDGVLDSLESLQAIQKNTGAALESANKALDSAIQSIDTVLPKIDAAINVLSTTQKADDIKKQELSRMINTLNQIDANLGDIRQKLSDIQNEAGEAAALIKEKADTLQNDLYQIESRTNEALTDYHNSIRGDLNTIGTRLVTSADNAAALALSAQKLGGEIGSMMQTAQEGAQLTSEISGKLQNKLVEFRGVIASLGGKLELVNNNDIVQIISILQSNPEFMGSFLSSPFEQKTESIYPIPNYGSSMTPIYTTLALWVGCLILNSLLRTEVAPFEGSETLTLREKHFGKMMTFCSMAVIQGLIVALGDILLLKVHVVNAFLFVCVAVFSSVVFCIITYTLFSTLGNGGKALAIIYMIFQLAGSGGSYPIQVDPAIFRVFQPLFPFAYTVGGFREAIAGPLVNAVMLDFVVLGLFALVFLISGYYLINLLHPRVHRFEKKFESSGLGE
ncbi:MAG TPA: YhgE/Pip domain-containing protein [Desulfitobacterium dehalogenans]|uniref:YhgE/Pip domain-containing protein n=1 Tax=Desulfitobacterium dehalogenans TaxID=36854 RepID=A0A7C7DB99_9FIRM|nr:YhgE/Pip domain-containing protein [Desulfitobacterium dehalogenans]